MLTLVEVHAPYFSFLTQEHLLCSYQPR